jgi:hypothetical protein
MAGERQGLGARAREDGKGGTDGRWPSPATSAQDGGSTRGAGRSGPERPTLAERPRRWGWGLTGEERVIRDMMIYHAVEIRRSPPRRVARIWKLTPARVSQIVKQFGRDLRDSPTLRETIEPYALECFSDVGN